MFKKRPGKNKTLKTSTAKNSVPSSSLNPLIDILTAALQEADVSLDIPLPTTTSQFALWYLETVKTLELALAVGASRPPVENRDIQMLCRCVLSAKDLQEAIGLVIEFSEMLHPRNGRQQMHIDDGVVVFSLDTLREFENPISHLVDITGLFAFYQLFQWLIGVELPLLRVNIGPAQRDDVLPFLRLFNAPVLAGKKKYTIEFPQAYLNQAVVRVNRELPAFIATFPCEVFGSIDNSLIRQIEALITAAIQQISSIPTLREMTNTLGVPESTLRRRLKQAGTSYRTLRENCLLEMAKRYLQRNDMSIDQISRQLGFSDDTSFRRAFRTWVNMSPSDWRKMHFEQAQIK